MTSVVVGTARTTKLHIAVGCAPQYFRWAGTYDALPSHDGRHTVFGPSAGVLEDHVRIVELLPQNFFVGL